MTSIINSIRDHSPRWTHTLSFRLFVIFVVSLSVTQMLSGIKNLSSPCVILVEFVQILLIFAGAWLAVRASIRPLIKLADEIKYLDPRIRLIRLDETGPVEIANAAAAPNAMQDTVAGHLKEHLLILAAMSHDLQTPITRMRLRAEFMDESCEKVKFCHDLGEVEHLITEGVSYARGAHTPSENEVPIDLNSFLETLAFDYQDMGKSIQYCPTTKLVVKTQPYVLRRLLVNLIDNALKYGHCAKINVQAQAEGFIAIEILDRGPGIPASELDRVLQPFYRIPNDRDNGITGSGLGLAIANQLARVLGGHLRLSARTGGGLCAQLTLDINDH